MKSKNTEKQIHFDEKESVIYVSNRHLSRISKIAYPSGEVIWNMGLPGEYGTGNNNICTDLLFSFLSNAFLKFLLYFILNLLSTFISHCVLKITLNVI